MRYSKKDPKYKAGYKAAQRSAMDKIDLIVGAIANDINRRSGLSPMLWADRHQRELITEEWRLRVRCIVETV